MYTNYSLIFKNKIMPGGGDSGGKSPSRGAGGGVNRPHQPYAKASDSKNENKEVLKSVTVVDILLYIAALNLPIVVCLRRYTFDDMHYQLSMWNLLILLVITSVCYMPYFFFYKKLLSKYNHLEIKETLFVKMNRIYYVILFLVIAHKLFVYL